MPRVVDHDARRDEIAAAAWQVIARDGFDQATMRSIAAEAGYSHSAFARYFPDKESLLNAVFLLTRGDADARIDELTAGKRGLEALHGMCVAALPFGPEGTRHARVGVAYWSYAAQNEAFWATQREHARRWRERIMRYLEEARDDGEIADDVDLVTASDRVASSNMGWQTIRLLMPEFSTDERMRAALDALLASLRRR